MNKTKTLKRLFFAALAIAAAGVYTSAIACTSLLVGKKASTDGSTFISYAADSHVLYGALAHQPAADHKPGSMREIRD